MKKDLISIEEKLSKNITKQQRNILFNMWVQQKYKKEKKYNEKKKDYLKMSGKKISSKNVAQKLERL